MNIAYLMKSSRPLWYNHERAAGIIARDGGHRRPGHHILWLPMTQHDLNRWYIDAARQRAVAQAEQAAERRQSEHRARILRTIDDWLLTLAGCTLALTFLWGCVCVIGLLLRYPWLRVGR